MSVLYVSYDGMLDQLGQSQVLPYLRRLAPGRPIVLVSYEKPGEWADVERRVRLARELQRAGILWIPLRYHGSLGMLGSAVNLLSGLLLGSWLTWRHKVKVLHARSLLAAIPCVLIKKFFPVRFIFDIRGFWADCRLEQGHWTASSSAYRLMKWFERECLMDADVVVALTQKAVDVMKGLPFLASKAPRFHVITTCADLALFRPADGASAAAKEGTFTLGYVGSIGPLYEFDAVLDCFEILRESRPDARLLILNRTGHAYIHERLRARGIEAGRVEVRGVDYADVPAQMRRMTVGIFLILPKPSLVAAVPTKMGEFLACGVPCIGNARVGNVAEVLEGGRVGVAVTEFTADAFRGAWKTMFALLDEPGIAKRCRMTAEEEFSLERGIASYEGIYRSLGA